MINNAIFFGIEKLIFEKVNITILSLNTKAIYLEEFFDNDENFEKFMTKLSKLEFYSDPIDRVIGIPSNIEFSSAKLEDFVYNGYHELIKFEKFLIETFQNTDRFLYTSEPSVTVATLAASRYYSEHLIKSKLLI